MAQKIKEFKFIICHTHYAVWRQIDMTGGKWEYLKKDDFENFVTGIGKDKNTVYTFHQDICRKCNKKSLWERALEALHW